jgi:hypothetical protein
MAEKTEFVLGANFGTPYGSRSQLIFSSGVLLPNQKHFFEKKCFETLSKLKCNSELQSNFG